MKQRVVIAIALACDPMLLLADEPTTALDVTIQAQILEKMEEFKRKLDTSIKTIMHDLGIIAESCDYVAIMYASEIIEVSIVKEIYESADHHPYTAGLLHSIPNLAVDTPRHQSGRRADARPHGPAGRLQVSPQMHEQDRVHRKLRERPPR